MQEVNFMNCKKSTASRGYTVVKRQNETVSESCESRASYTTDVASQEGGLARKFESIAHTNYKIPAGGTYQDNMSKSEIKKKLIGYKSLKTDESKRYLLTLTPFKVWIKYYNPTTKQFRTGGLMMKVDPQLRYMMLVNTSSNITWSVQLKDNIIFVPDPSKKEQEATRNREVK